MADDYAEFLDTIASRLTKDSFSVQRNVQTNLYTFNILALRNTMGFMMGGARVPLSTVVSVIYVDAPSANGVSAYSSFVAKYAVENRRSLGVRFNGLRTIPVMVSPSIRDDVKQWVSETPPSYSNMWDRTAFSVVIDVSSHSISYYTKTPFRHGFSYPELRDFSDKWFSFQTEAS